mgnify:CR=1 FL=1
MIRKKDLQISQNLKSVFETINQHLYAKLKSTDTDTRSRSKQIVNLLLCKLYDEVTKDPEDYLEFQIKNGETPKILAKRIKSFFHGEVKKKYGSILTKQDEINLSPDLIYLFIEKVQSYSLLKSSRDILKDAFEIFVSKILKEEGGQFFTPQNIIEFMVRYLDPTPNSKILDPACGHGGFLLESKELLWSKIDRKYNAEDKIKKQKINSISNFYGIDKDLFLTKICKLYLDILSGGNSKIYCEDSLNPSEYDENVKTPIQNGTFDYILTNPPFGAKIPIDDKNLLKKYELGYVWKNYASEGWKKTKSIRTRQPPQILFIERCIQLLKDGGKLGIILPEGIFGNPSDRYIWEFLKQKGRILGIISLDQNAFQPFTCNKTSILFFQKLEEIPEDYKIDFAVVENVGHDKDGKVCYKLSKHGTPIRDAQGSPIINDDLRDLNSRIEHIEDFDYQKEQSCFKIKLSDIKNNIFIPNYYMGVEKKLKKLENDEQFELISIQELADRNILYTNRLGYLPRGNEIGSQVYGLGDVPFIRTSEISNWEINLDANKKTSEEVYEKYKEKQNIEVGDILLVKDGGSNLIGKTAFITRLDTKIIIQSHIYQLKTLKNNVNIDPYLILYLLNLDIVQRQIEAITFIQGTIATIGSRVMELKLPFPKDMENRRDISKYIQSIIHKKTEIRENINNLSLDLLNS